MKQIYYILVFGTMLLTACETSKEKEDSYFSVTVEGVEYNFQNEKSDDLIEHAFNDQVESVICFPENEDDDSDYPYAVIMIRHSMQGDGEYTLMSADKFSNADFSKKVVYIELSLSSPKGDALYDPMDLNNEKVIIRKVGDLFHITLSEPISLIKFDDLETEDQEKLPNEVKLSLTNIYALRNILN